jgi:microcystin-dependent protein
MSFSSGLSQRTTLTGVFYSNSTTQTYSNTEANLSLLASLQYVQSFTNYFIYLTYLPINNPTFEGIGMNGENITLSGNLSTPVINGSCNFTGSPKIQNQNIEFDIIGEIKIVMNEIPNNYLLCNGSSISTTDYPDLFNLIFYTYGGSGNTFNLPNFESKFPIGANSSNANGNPTSNFATGNGTTGATNTQSVSYIAPGNVSLLTQVPPHTHNINDPLHSHQNNVVKNVNAYVELDPVEPIYPPIVQEGNTLPGTQIVTGSMLGLSIESIGDDIQVTDPISGLYGVNISPSYISVKYCICFSQ